jgi:hypothetical protein
MRTGRPPDYNPGLCDKARKLCELGATDREIADFFEVSERTIHRWKIEHQDFCHSLKTAKETADERVERSLYHRAIGYSFDSVKIFNDKGVSLEVPFIEHVPPDTTAAIFWLKNRRPDQWREKTTQEVTGADGKPLIPEQTASDTARRLAFLLFNTPDPPKG